MELYVGEYGPADAPALVLLHGGGLSGRMWEPQIQRLAEYHCVVPDLPEQGRSAAIAPFTLDDAAQRVAALIRSRCTNGRAHVVGLSLGGAVALTLMRLAPETVDHAIISGSAARLGRLLGAVSKSSARLYRFISSDTLVKVALKQFGIPPTYADLLRADLHIGTTERFTRSYTDALMHLELPRQSGAPTLVAVGERETPVALRAARTISKALPQAQGVLVPDLGHVWNLQAPDLFTAMIRDWCERSVVTPGLRRL